MNDKKSKQNELNISKYYDIFFKYSNWQYYNMHKYQKLIVIDPCLA